MRAEFEVAVGNGRAGASLAFDRAREDGVRTNPWLLALAAALTIPFAVALTLSAIASSTHATLSQGIASWLIANGAPGAVRLIALGPALALILFAVARIRLHAGREDGRWVGRLTARLTAWEVAVGIVALAIVTVFVGHLFADTWACANGVRSAC